MYACWVRWETIWETGSYSVWFKRFFVLMFLTFENKFINFNNKQKIRYNSNLVLHPIDSRFFFITEYFFFNFVFAVLDKRFKSKKIHNLFSLVLHKFLEVLHLLLLFQLEFGKTTIYRTKLNLNYIQSSKIEINFREMFIGLSMFYKYKMQLASINMCFLYLLLLTKLINYAGPLFFHLANLIINSSSLYSAIQSRRHNYT